MRYLRARPWRARGPWLGVHAGTRRRGHFDSASVNLVVDSQQHDDAVVTHADEVDRLLAAAPARDLTELPLTEHVVAARIDEAGLHAARTREPGASAALDPIDALAEAALAARHHDAISRQSA